jgi:hypothetical protein
MAAMKQIEIRGLELDIKETQLNKEEFDAQTRFDERRAEIDRERTDLYIEMKELQITELKEI